mgnify:FL=1|tara:strand:+ start:6222 stop:7310 length:1089 start_codon:yes stop_codon:yes gene_type:complete
MTAASLEGFSSYVREVDGECLFVRVVDNFLFCGSRSGDVACWDICSGTELWRLSFEGPCTDSDFDDGVFFFTESENVHAIQVDSGGLIWSTKLEGSSDFIVVSNDFVWVTSSVYNFEIQDYSEGSVWQINLEGEVRNRWDVEGRSWSLLNQDGKLVLGLSRPNSGYAIVSDSGLEFPDMGQQEPVTVGNGGGSGPVVLGHGNGMVSKIVDHTIESVSQFDSSVQAIDYFCGWVVGLDSGEVASSIEYDSWSVKLDGMIDVLCFGPSLDSERGVWVPSWRDGGAVIFLINPNGGNVELQIFHKSRIVSAFSDEEVICFGDADGCVFVIEGEVLRRRFAQPMEEVSDEDRRSELRRKIRGLRGS